jgi:hypothetical protein
LAPAFFTVVVLHVLLRTERRQERGP